MSAPITQKPEQTEKYGIQDQPISDAEIAERNKRIALLKRVAGIWANRDDIPADSVDYQRQLRAELV